MVWLARLLHEVRIFQRQRPGIRVVPIVKYQCDLSWLSNVLQERKRGQKRRAAALREDVQKKWAPSRPQFESRPIPRDFNLSLSP
ncbi:hypothetical protein TESG_08282 [Trichophyton tonsurans CBS 112818]|uniref:Uncharacterized protein n=1 Tax=Trichophyton tonsurans (strain CBS 112818) TaxID=647933 RepID=F2RQD1_TRIT1|nr:hypothetical protein TESG_08282 [Trichophyton tonsurans CBS 112818]